MPSAHVPIRQKRRGERGAALVIVLFNIINPPPLTPEIDGDPSTGLWLACKTLRGGEDVLEGLREVSDLPKPQPE